MGTPSVTPTRRASCIHPHDWGTVALAARRDSTRHRPPGQPTIRSPGSRPWVKVEAIGSPYVRLAAPDRETRCGSGAGVTRAAFPGDRGVVEPAVWGEGEPTASRSDRQIDRGVRRSTRVATEGAHDSPTHQLVGAGFEGIAMTSQVDLDEREQEPTSHTSTARAGHTPRPLLRAHRLCGLPIDSLSVRSQERLTFWRTT